MNVVHFSDAFFPTIGGVQTHISSLVDYLKNDEFTIITDALKDEKDEEQFSDNCRIIRFGPHNVISDMGNKLLFPQRLAASRTRHKKKIDWINGSKTEVVHVHGFNIGMDTFKLDRYLNKRSFSKSISFDELKKPALLTMHGLISPYNDSKVYAEFEKELVSRFSEVICVDRSIYDFVNELGTESNIHFIPNSIDTDGFKFQPLPDFKELKVTYIGRPDPFRGFDLIRGLAKQIPNGIKLNLVIATDSSKPLGIESKKDLTILTDLDQDSVAKEIASSHLILNPLRIPVISRVALEAMAIGRPVVTTPLGEVGPISNDKTGFIAQDNVIAIRKFLAEISKDKSRIEEVGKKASEKVNKEYSHKVIIPKIKKLYKKTQDGGK